MAADLSTTPISGIPVIIDGDSHLNNFGMYGTALRDLHQSSGKNLDPAG